jgi:hypothetical protein
MAKKTKLKKAFDKLVSSKGKEWEDFKKANTKNPSPKKKKPTHLQCKCSNKSGGIKIFKNATKNPSGKIGYLGKCDVYNNPDGSVVVKLPETKDKKIASPKKRKSNPSKPKDKWMQDLDLKKGSLREYVAQEYGDKGFETSKISGNKIIKPEILKEIANDKDLPEKRQREAELAIKFNKARKARGKK